MSHHHQTLPAVPDFAENTEGLTFTIEKVKVRFIDPPVLVSGVLAPLSEIDPDYAERIAAHRTAQQGPLHLRALHPDED